MEKEESVIVLDYLPYGYPLERNHFPVVQAIGKNNFTLLQLAPRKGENFQSQEEVYIGEGKRDKIQFIQGRLLREKLTENAKAQLSEVIAKSIAANEAKYVEFFNKAQAINTRLHQFELLPGFGKKHSEAVLEERENKPFESMEDIRKRVHGIPDPQKAIEKRIFEELTEIQRQNLFIR
jgi:putative nucleotide binding protein